MVARSRRVHALLRSQKAAILVSIVFIAACLILGCGGGGGGSSASGGGGGTTGTTVIEAIVAGSAQAVIDTQNIMVLDSVTFEVVNYDVNNVRTVLTATNWSTSDTGNVAGVLDPATGAYTATAPGGIFTISASANGNNYQTTYRVTPRQSRLFGKVADASSGIGVSGIVVLFYDASGTTLVGSITSSYNGNFLASVPTTAKFFNLKTTSIPAGLYHRSFSYNGLRYSPTVPCSAPTPGGLANGVETVMPATIALPPSSLSPPGPPDGCQ